VLLTCIHSFQASFRCCFDIFVRFYEQSFLFLFPVIAAPLYAHLDLDYIKWPVFIAPCFVIYELSPTFLIFITYFLGPLISNVNE
jgi:hypothetical protein